MGTDVAPANSAKSKRSVPSFRSEPSRPSSTTVNAASFFSKLPSLRRNIVTISARSCGVDAVRTSAPSLASPSLSCIGSVSRRELPRLKASTRRPSKPTEVIVTCRSSAWKLNFIGVVPKWARGRCGFIKCLGPLGLRPLPAAATAPALLATADAPASTVPATADAPFEAADPTAAADSAARASTWANALAVPSTALSIAESTEAFALPMELAAPAAAKGLAKGLVAIAAPLSPSAPGCGQSPGRPPG